MDSTTNLTPGHASTSEHLDNGAITSTNESATAENVSLPHFASCEDLSAKVAAHKRDRNLLPNDGTLFDKDDVALAFTDTEKYPQILAQAVAHLVVLARLPVVFGTGNESYGRFELSEGYKDARRIRALFRVGHRALTFLWADFLACEKADSSWFGEEAQGFAELQARGDILDGWEDEPDAAAGAQDEDDSEAPDSVFGIIQAKRAALVADLQAKEKDAKLLKQMQEQNARERARIQAQITLLNQLRKEGTALGIN